MDPSFIWVLNPGHSAERRGVVIKSTQHQGSGLGPLCILLYMNTKLTSVFQLNACLTGDQEIAGLTPAV